MDAATLLKYIENNLIKARSSKLNPLLQQLDKKPHFIPISEKILEGPLLSKLQDTIKVGKTTVNTKQYLLEQIRLLANSSTYGGANKINLVAGNFYPIRPIKVGNIVLDSKVPLTAETFYLLPFPCTVIKEDKVFGIFFKDFNQAQGFSSYLNRTFSNLIDRVKAEYTTIELKSGELGTKLRSGIDLGHTVIHHPTDSPLKDQAQSPLYVQLRAIEAVFNALTQKSMGQSTLDLPPEIQNLLFNLSSSNTVSNAISEIETLIGRLQTTHSYGTVIEQELSKDFGEAVLSAGININIVIPQDSLENQIKWGANVEQTLKKELMKILATVHFSRSLEEEIGYKVMETIVRGKSPTDSILKKKVSSTKKLDPILPTTLKASTGTVRRPSANISKTQNFKTTNLITLQTLLNSALRDQIVRNMRKPALQNRTGRFAQSAKVERLSESRQGMITAFYSYMKSPYQTFEPGFKQGSEARNPKTLISKSIREIAASIVGNRLRAVRI